MNKHQKDFVNAAKITGGTVLVGSYLMANAGTRVVLFGAQQGLAQIGKGAKHVEKVLRDKEKSIADPALYASAQVILDNVKDRIPFLSKPAKAAIA